MTNVSSGSKRAWDGPNDTESHKRPREDARDWRDVHLDSPRRKGPGRRDTDNWDRRGGDRRPSRGDYRPRSRDGDHDRRRPRDYSGGRDRRDDRDRDRERDRSRASRRDNSRGSDRRRDHHSRRPSPPHPRDKHVNGGSDLHPHATKVEDEKEEGEISPRPSREMSPRSGRGPYPPRARAARPSDVQAQTKPHSKPQPAPEPEMVLELPPSPPHVEETVAARRAKRQAIMAKYAGIASSTQGPTPSPGPSSAVEPPPATPDVSNLPSQAHSVVGTPGASESVRGESIRRDSAAPEKRQTASASPTPDTFALAKGDEEEEVQAKAQEDGVGEQVSAADYDPCLDRREDEHKRVWGTKEEPHDVEMIEEEEEEEDDVDDMFAVAATTEMKKVKKVKRVFKPAAPAIITATLDSAADSEGYYQVILGEQLDGGRYQVFSALGKGMFANVVRARVLQGDANEAGKEVAIKIVRCQESMFKAGLKEVQILNKLKQADPEDKKHVVRLERTFEHRGHLCLVFESLSMNLRDVVKRFGKDVGLNIRAVRAYSHQLFLALSLVRKCNIMHADIKPDNILVNEQKTLLKLCDLGSASDASENEITPYLVSRFYRAPEIIMGHPYDPAIDIWSIGCTLYELYTGKILFPGRSNNHMLLLMMELKGRFNQKMIKRAKFGDMYFDELGAFLSVEPDRVTGLDAVRKVHITKPTRDLRQRVLPPNSVKLKDEESKLLLSFVDLLEKCLALDPLKRITPKEALVHPFIRG
ncbi:kinase-like domain-containing protein [Ganoderma leucocontextum]|nr:kinase-like domain-containing protein [Ganoderma leucocontextum]